MSAVAGDYLQLEEKLKETRVEVGEGETLGSVRAEWGKNPYRSGRLAVLEIERMGHL